MRPSRLIAAATVLLLGVTAPPGRAAVAAGLRPMALDLVTTTFVAAGPTLQTWKVPPTVTVVDLVAYGAPGGGGAPGGKVTMRIVVTPGSLLDIWVGLPGTDGDVANVGIGGWGGRMGLRRGGYGGSGRPTSPRGSGGGGATEIDVRNGSAAPPIVAIAAGGGGRGSFSSAACGTPGAGGCGTNVTNGQGEPGNKGVNDITPTGIVGGVGYIGYSGQGFNTGGGGSGASIDTAEGGGGGGGGYGGGGGGGSWDTGTPGGGGTGRSLTGTGAIGPHYSGAPAGTGAGVTFTYSRPSAPAGATMFTPLAPQRVLDTREVADITAGNIVPAGGSIDVQITGRGGVMGDAIAVVLNVTVTDAVGPGFITAWPTGQTRPTTSNLNVTVAGQTIANLVTVQLSSAGKVSLYTQSGAHLVADVEGFYSTAKGAVAEGRFTPLSPSRLLDTRAAIGVDGTTPVAAGTVVDLLVAGRGGTPVSGVSAVVLNITAVDATAAGYITMWPTGLTRPTTSTLNATFAGQNIPNLVIVPLGAGGRVSLFTQSGTHLVADVLGWFGDSTQQVALAGLFQPLTPARVLDTRTPLPATAGVLAADQELTLSVVGVGGIPATGVAAVVANVTATDAAGPGFVTVWPADASRPVASNLNVTERGQSIANLVTVGVSATGTVSMYSLAGTHLIADVFGYYISG